MPFPWKKAKVNRISRLVADLHQCPKRGGSLVVETGFPTSLIDLFVKNRDRLRKPPKRKPAPRPITQIHTHPHSPLQSFPLPPPPPPRCDIDVEEFVLVKREECNCDDERIAFHHAAFKVSLAVALAVGTRNFVVWIMMAAFLLVLLEFVGMRFFGCLRPQSLFLFLASWVRKGLLVLNKRCDLDWDWEQGSVQVLVAKQPQRDIAISGYYEEDNCVDEIQLAESKLDFGDKRCEIESEMLEKRMEILIRESESEHMCSGRRGARIKANLIKKFVPKKLRKLKKQGKKSNQSVVDVSLEKLDKVEDDGEDHQSQAEVEEEIEEVEEIEIDEEEEEESCRQSTSSVQGLGVLELEEETKECMILMVLGIVLVGLLGGRSVALLLTLVWFLMVRYSSQPIRFGFGFGRFRLRSCQMAEMGTSSTLVCLNLKNLKTQG